MKYPRLYTDNDGETHFEDVEVEVMGQRPGLELSKMMELEGLQFRRSTGEFDVEWHPAPRKQFVLILTGGTVVTASDGETRRFAAGSLPLLEDTTGKGHLTKAINTPDGDRWSVFLPLR